MIIEWTYGDIAQLQRYHAIGHWFNWSHVSTFAVGRLSVAFSHKDPNVAFTSLMPGVAFSSKDPNVEFSHKIPGVTFTHKKPSVTFSGE